jgi:hypothetical protein
MEVCRWNHPHTTRLHRQSPERMKSRRDVLDMRLIRSSMTLQEQQMCRLGHRVNSASAIEVDESRLPRIGQERVGPLRQRKKDRPVGESSLIDHEKGDTPKSERGQGEVRQRDAPRELNEGGERVKVVSRAYLEVL